MSSLLNRHNGLTSTAMDLGMNPVAIKVISVRQFQELRLKTELAVLTLMMMDGPTLMLTGLQVQEPMLSRRSIASMLIKMAMAMVILSAASKLIRAH